MNSHFFLPRTVATEWIKLHLDRMYARPQQTGPSATPRSATHGRTPPPNRTELASDSAWRPCRAPLEISTPHTASQQ